MKTFPWFLCAAVVLSIESSKAAQAVRVGTGFSQPLFATAPAGDMSRLFVVEKGGAIKILNLTTGVTNPTPFLSLSVSTQSERGLLGLAFHPDYATNGKFYVNLTNLAGNTEIREYTVSSDPNVANTSGNLIMTYTQPFDNHNGGWLGFGPNDGYLYIASGDGGSGNDPQNNAQNLSSPLGKMLRVDVNSDQFTSDANRDYAIPATNPFITTPNAAPEIWAYGLRNPWRNSFDRLTGDFYIGDVGQNTREEINFQSADSAGGQNYGWRPREGSGDNPGVGDPAPAGAVNPIYDYTRGNGNFQGESVTGGYVYRGTLAPELQGQYFFGDFVDRKIWSFTYSEDGGTVTGLTSWTQALGQTFGNISSFGEGGTGELYIVEYNGSIYQVIPEPGTMALGGAGLLLLAWRGRGQKRNAA